jgi:GxxExxY protein
LPRRITEYAKTENGIDDIFKLCDVIRETGFAIHCYHRNGFREKIYENALVHRLRKLGLSVQQQPVQVFDEDSTVLGDDKADLIIEECLVAEAKACKALTDEHVAQILGYMRGTRIEHGLLMNFGARKFQIRKFILTRDRYEPPIEE